MADRFAYLYQEHLHDTEFIDLIRKFSSKGIFLANPATGFITCWSEEGDSFTVTSEWLVSQVTLRKTVGFEWWLDDSIDLYCRLRFLPDLIVEEYGLDGLGEKITLINDILIERFKESVRAGIARGIVIDNEGVTEDYDWDTFFVEGLSFDAEFPDILGIKSSELDRIKTETQGLHRESISNFVILSRP